MLFLSFLGNITFSDLAKVANFGTNYFLLKINVFHERKIMQVIA